MKRIKRNCARQPSRSKSAVHPLNSKKRHRRFLEELLALCDPSARPSKADRAWLSAPPRGRELI
jgi:hypothetical protein